MQRLSLLSKPTLTYQVASRSTARFGKFNQDILGNAVLNATYRPNTEGGKQLAKIQQESDTGLRDYRLIQCLQTLDYQAPRNRIQTKIEIQAAAHKLCASLSTVVGKMWARDILEKSDYQYSLTTKNFLSPPA